MRVADITNFKAVLKAMRGVDAVIHLAANPNVDRPWQDVYASGIGGTYNSFVLTRFMPLAKHLEKLWINFLSIAMASKDLSRLVCQGRGDF
jgi:hypothetical protein